MIALAVSLRVSIEPAEYFFLTVEACLWDSGENGVVQTWLPGYCLPQTVQGVLTPTGRQNCRETLYLLTARGYQQ